MVGIEAGVDERVDGLRDGVLHGAQRPAQLLVVGVVAAVEQPELRLMADHEAEVGGEAELHLLAWALGQHEGASDGRQQVLGDGVDELEVQRPLGGEVLVEERLRDARRLCDVVHRRRAVAPMCEELECHREELVAALLRGEPPGGGLDNS